MVGGAHGRPAEKGHPRGLWVLAGTELCERASFYGIQALLTLYLAGALLLPSNSPRVLGFQAFRWMLDDATGSLSAEALAAQMFGVFIGLMYLTPVLGGLIGDRFIGRRIAVVAGALLMIAGYIALATDRIFLVALVLLVLGGALLRGNLSAQVGTLYRTGDRREADAFQIYYAALCMGAFLGPLAGGLIAAHYGWQMASRVAACSMTIGLLVYLGGLRCLPADLRRIVAARRSRLTATERNRVAALFVVWVLMVCFWVAQVQVWNVYNLWVADHVALDVAGRRVPVPWLQALDGLAPALLGPVVVLWWRYQARRDREPDLFGKLATGCFVFAGALGLLALAPLVEDIGGRAPLALPITFHVLSNLGTVYVVPVALTLFAAEAPSSLRGAMININSLAVFFASVLSGRLGALYGAMSPSVFWLAHAAVVAAAGASFTLLRRPLGRRFTGGEYARRLCQTDVAGAADR